MEIKDVVGTILAPPEYPGGAYLLVEVESDDGLKGLGEGFAYSLYGEAIHAAKMILDKGLKRILIGEDALEVERLYEKMVRTTEYNARRHGLEMSAISGVDMALWDPAGKALGRSVSELLGGRYREEVRVYASALFKMKDQDLTVKEARGYADEGYTAIKMGYGGFGFDYEKDVAMIKAIRDTIGYDIDLMVDGPAALNYARSLGLAKALEKYEVFWWEEPILREDLDGYAKLASSVDIRIAAGEGERTRFGFRDLIDKEAVDVIQPDISWVGGITETKRIAEMAYLHNIEWVPHHWGTVINMAASLHMVAARPDGFICEYAIGPRTREHKVAREKAGASPMMVELPVEPLEVGKGYIRVPKGPGLGIELDPKSIEKWSLR